MFTVIHDDSVLRGIATEFLEAELFVTLAGGLNVLNSQTNGEIAEFHYPLLSTSVFFVNMLSKFN